MLRMDRHRSAYSTSFPVDVVTVVLDDGTRRRLVAKHLRWDTMLPAARRTKPRFLYDPDREPGVYRELLDHRRHGTPRRYGVVDDRLLLERVPGVELYQIGDRAEWERAARWLAGFHAEFATRVDDIARADVPLLRHDAPYYRRWIERARRFTPDARVDRLADRYDVVVERLLAQPVTLIHGELYASNVIVDGDRICPIDWEMAAIGPALIDLAALSSGTGWSETDRAAIVDAYGGADDGDLDACRAHLAVQWLGWSPAWTPPPELAHDWLSEATAAADRLGL